MLTSKAFRLTRTLAPASPLSSSIAVSRAIPSLCEMFGVNLRLASTPSFCNKPSTASISGNLLLADKAQSSAVHRGGIRYFSSKSNAPEDDKPTIPAHKQPSQQHETWVEFQKSIVVAGVETGQTTRINTRTKKRGGVQERKRREREAELEALMKGGDEFDITTLKGGEYPPLRYSDEETARLLEEAYANIPKRDGKRGTLHLKREKRRWWIKRMYDAKKKHERMAEHERRMAKRHNISQWIYEIRSGAEEVRNKDKEYQMGILNRWAEMNGYAKKDSQGLVEQNE